MRAQLALAPPAGNRLRSEMGAQHPCAAGRSAFFGGKWREPCPNVGRHAIGSPAREPVWLCDLHFAEVSEAGLVAEPYIGKAEFERRERKNWWRRPLRRDS
jgi:hypothetical protein